MSRLLLAFITGGLWILVWAIVATCRTEVAEAFDSPPQANQDHD